MSSQPLPRRLSKIVDEFADLSRDLKLELLREYANALPPLPERYATDRGALERVYECQTPFFVATELADGHVRLWFDAPDESPTTTPSRRSACAGSARSSPPCSGRSAHRPPPKSQIRSRRTR